LVNHAGMEDESGVCCQAGFVDYLLDPRSGVMEGRVPLCGPLPLALMVMMVRALTVPRLSHQRVDSA
jgi:hypothetical protein